MKKAILCGLILLWMACSILLYFWGYILTGFVALVFTALVTISTVLGIVTE